MNLRRKIEAEHECIRCRKMKVLYKGTKLCQYCWEYNANRRALKKAAKPVKAPRNLDLYVAIRHGLNTSTCYEELFGAAKQINTLDMDLRAACWADYSLNLKRFWPETMTYDTTYAASIVPGRDY